jgi:hypothetical protein
MKSVLSGRARKLAERVRFEKVLVRVICESVNLHLSSLIKVGVGRACAPLHRAVHIDHGKFLVTAGEPSALDK